MPPVGVTSESSFAVGQSALRSSGTSPNFRISLASLKSPLDVPGPQREHAAYRLRPTLLRPSRATSILPPTRPSRPAAETPGRRCREATPGDGSQGRANARMRQMSEVTYYVALPFVFSDDGMAAGEAAECLSANSPVRGVYRTPALMDQNEIQKSGRQQNSEDHIGVEVHVLAPRPVAAPASGRGA
jgi:hypothetical protein